MKLPELHLINYVNRYIGKSVSLDDTVYQDFYNVNIECSAILGGLIHEILHWHIATHEQHLYSNLGLTGGGEGTQDKAHSIKYDANRDSYFLVNHNNIPSSEWDEDCPGLSLLEEEWDEDKEHELCRQTLDQEDACAIIELLLWTKAFGFDFLEENFDSLIGVNADDVNPYCHNGFGFLTKMNLAEIQTMYCQYEIDVSIKNDRFNKRVMDIVNKTMRPKLDINRVKLRLLTDALKEDYDTIRRSIPNAKRFYSTHVFLQNGDKIRLEFQNQECDYSIKHYSTIYGDYTC